jgi:DNA-binding response OmpR family regulator
MKRILIIEDDYHLSKVLKRLLEQDGAEVIVQSTGRSAMEFIGSNEKIDLIVLDLELPDSKGLGLLKELKEKTSVPVIINSGYSHYKSEFTSWLADDYVVKKSDPDELRARVMRILEGEITGPE